VASQGNISSSKTFGLTFGSRRTAAA